MQADIKIHIHIRKPQKTQYSLLTDSIWLLTTLQCISHSQKWAGQSLISA